MEERVLAQDDVQPVNLLELPHQLSKRPLKIMRNRRVDSEGDLLVHLAGGHSEELSSELETYRG